jgi:hypothetical protein
MRTFLSVALVGLLLCPSLALCWWDEGHQVVARVAARHLTPAALLRVSQLLEVDNTPEAVADAMAAASVWADQVKGDTGTASWHFIDLNWQDSRTNLSDRCPNDDCATARVRMFATQLKANDPDADSRFTDEDALRFLIHFVADLHQPLHASTNADQGGNCEQLAMGVDDAANLHALWDGPLVGRMGVDDKALAAELNDELDQSTDQDRVAAATGTEEDWAWESHRVALASIYKRLDMAKMDAASPATCAEAPDEVRRSSVIVDEKYLDEMRPVVREQLKKAGLRLARLLNDIFS